MLTAAGAANATGIRIRQDIRQHAERKGMTGGHSAFNWVLNNVFVDAELAGPRTLEQWEEYLGALDHRLDAGR